MAKSRKELPEAEAAAVTVEIAYPPDDVSQNWQKTGGKLLVYGYTNVIGASTKSAWANRWNPPNDKIDDGEEDTPPPPRDGQPAYDWAFKFSHLVPGTPVIVWVQVIKDGNAGRAFAQTKVGG